MKAYLIDKYSKEKPMRLSNVPTPSLKDNDLLIEVHAAGLNPLDAKIKSGELKLLLSYKMPLILGHDLAGIVIEIGKNVRKFKVGDEVYSRPPDLHIGTFAEFIAVNEEDVARKPKNLSMEEAASLPLVALTAWQVLVEKGAVRRDHKVFIQAGSGGVGTIAIQLAKHLGAYVATTAGAKSFDLVKGLGADVVVDYRNERFEKRLSNYDLVLNSQDKSTLEKSITILSPGGKVISISGPPTPKFAISMHAPWFLRYIMFFMSLGIRNKAKKAKVSYSFLFMRAQGEQLNEVTKLVESGYIRPVIDKIFSFNEFNKALEFMESGRSKGKVVVKIK